MIEYRMVAGMIGIRVGSDGSVWACRDRRGNPTRPWNQLSTYRRPYGNRYTVVCIRPQPREKVGCYYVHRLVCEAFHGPQPIGMLVCHNNGDTSDNRSENLRWGTPKENMADQIHHGTRMQGEKSPFAKLTADKVREIRSLQGSGRLQRDIGREFGVCQTVVSAIMRRKTWKHVE